LSLKTLGRRVIPIFVGAGLEFKETLEYVDDLARQLDVSLLKLKAPIKKAAESGRELPTKKKNRVVYALKGQSNTRLHKATLEDWPGIDGSGRP